MVNGQLPRNSSLGATTTPLSDDAFGYEPNGLIQTSPDEFARNNSAPDRLKQIFTDRHSHKSLAEQKVSDWLLRYRSYAHCSPKDLTDIPDNIWAPLDVDPSSRNNAASEFNMARSAKGVQADQLKHRMLNCARRKDLSDHAMPTLKPNDAPKRRLHSVTSTHCPVMRSSVIKYQIPYFFQPPYRQSYKSAKLAQYAEKSISLKKAQNYMDLSKGLLTASGLPK
ncbi:unnamed protein product [Mesocestoides corti]|uniref:Uncharacterized protein n=1 Tax=Mesocestoides corti TaxID=53468 RepID=A0A0R3U243_MESCO|nr:unnamed protein product [Mesocestoides corti]